MQPSTSSIQPSHVLQCAWSYSGEAASQRPEVYLMVEAADALRYCNDTRKAKAYFLVALGTASRFGPGAGGQVAGAPGGQVMH